MICASAKENAKSGFRHARERYREDETCHSILNDLHEASAALDYLRSCAAMLGCASSANAAQFSRLANELQIEIDRRVDEERVRIERHRHQTQRVAQTEENMRPANDR